MESGRRELVHVELERILASEGFARNERLKGFLRYVVEQELSGCGDQLKESLVGIEVFGRRPDYDVRQDSVVRTEAARLRARLAEYYANGGATDRCVIELPKGGYRPIFREVGSGPETRGRSHAPHRLAPRTVAAGTAFASAVALLVGWSLLRTRTPSVSIAVLPLINLSQDSNSDYFADGLTSEIIRNLSIIDGLVVRSQTSSFVFKGKPRNIRDAGKELDAEYIVEGSVFRSGEQLRINAQLIRVRDDFPLWSGRYDRELTDVFAIQDEISRGIVNGLRLKLGRGRRRYETSAAAYDLYLHARAFETESAGAGRHKSVPFYEQAIAKDPSFAPAYAGLGAAYAFRTGEDRLAKWAVLDRTEEMSRMHTVVEKALQLDPLLAEAHAARGMVLARDAQWQQAEKSFRHALELEPSRALTRTDFALSVLLPLGRIDEAVAQARLAEQNDRLSPSVEEVLAYTLFSAGRIDEAATHCPQPCTRALVLRGRANEAIPVLEDRFKDNPKKAGTGDLGYAYARAGRREDAERMAANQPLPIEQAKIFVGLGDKDRAFEALNRAIPMGPVRIGRDLQWPEFAPLRGDPRLKALRRRVGLPD
jgi:TolB-like protein/tetratricopeptide (TPR) repeat protein